jgi:magnesium transporter
MFTQEDLITNVRDLIERRDGEGLLGLTGSLSWNDWAEVVPHLEDEEIAYLLEVLPDSDVPEVLAELDPSHAAEILLTFDRSEAADVLEAMDPDDATDVIDELSDTEAEQILIEMAPDEAAELRELLAYPPDTAGGIMTPAFVAIAPDLRADQAITALRQISQEAETMYYVYVLDPEEHLLGVLSLYRIVLTAPDTPVRELMVTDPITVRADADREDAAALLTDRNLLALPVVDEANRLLGIITQDDIADVLEEEATEDIERLGGSQPLEVPYRRASVSLLFRRRVGWLLLLFVAEAYTGTVIRHYDAETALVPALIWFLPLLTGTGGNIGSQVTTTLVRAIAVGEVRLRDVRWVFGKEVAVGAILGIVMAGVAFGRSQLLHAGSDVGYVVALTVLAICVWSAMVAAVLPLFIRKLRIDPAVVSAPLITTLVDGTGLVIYFTIAKYMLNL